jgi:hypothetical protein
MNASSLAFQRRPVLLRRLVALFALALLAVTWRLWTPQTVYPQVPFLGLLRDAPAALQWLVLAGQGVALLTALLAPARGRLGRIALAAFAGLTLAAVLFDQHRLQPWAYQFAVVAVVLAGCAPARAGTLLRVLTISLYFYSAVSKFDYVFLHTVGQQFLAALLDFVGIDAAELSDLLRLALAALFPLGELLVALGLCFRRTSRVALAGAVATHLLLLVLLGPFGLGHKPAVLVWNVYFIAQDLLLFGGRREGEAPAEPERVESRELRAESRTAAPRRNSLAAPAILGAVVLLPLLEPLGWFDHWPAWGLYAPKASRVVVQVRRSAAERLPKSLRRHLRAESEASPWLRLRIADWSLAALDAPIYPQARFQLGVAEAVVRRYRLARSAQIHLFTAADRQTGKRESETLVGLRGVENAAEWFWLNVHPAGRYFDP